MKKGNAPFLPGLHDKGTNKKYPFTKHPPGFQTSKNEMIQTTENMTTPYNMQ